MTTRIIQIIAAEPGWNVAYRAGAKGPGPGIEESRGVEFVPIACWAWVEDDQNNRAVLPMSADDTLAGLILNDPGNPKALGVSPPGCRPADWAHKLKASKPKSKPISRREEKPEPARSDSRRSDPRRSDSRRSDMSDSRRQKSETARRERPKKPDSRKMTRPTQSDSRRVSRPKSGAFRAVGGPKKTIRVEETSDGLVLGETVTADLVSDNDDDFKLLDESPMNKDASDDEIKPVPATPEPATPEPVKKEPVKKEPVKKGAAKKEAAQQKSGWGAIPGADVFDD